MLKKKMKSRLGFTLAELLIVVAILAVLVAVAVPLFVGALNNAQEKVLAANERAVRGAAVAEILMNPAVYNPKDTAKWGVKAVVNKSGDITALEIIPGGDAVGTSGKGVETEVGTKKVKATADDYYITLTITELAVEKGAVAGG